MGFSEDPRRVCFTSAFTYKSRHREGGQGIASFGRSGLFRVLYPTPDCSAGVTIISF